MSEKRASNLKEDTREDARAALKLEKNGILSFLIDDFWRWHKLSRATNPSGLVASEISCVFRGNPPHWFNDENLAWAKQYGHSRAFERRPQPKTYVPSNELDLKGRSITPLYEQALLNLHLSLSRWSEEEKTRLKPYLDRLRVVLQEWHSHTFITFWPEEPLPHMSVGLTTACGTLFGLIEAFRALNPSTDPFEVEKCLLNPMTLKEIKHLASLSLDEFRKFIAEIELGKVYPNSREVQNIAPYRRTLNPNCFSLHDGHFAIKDRDYLQAELLAHNAPKTGCPVLKKESGASNVLPELWHYFVELSTAQLYFDHLSNREKTGNRIAAREQGTTLINHVLVQMESTRKQLGEGINKKTGFLLEYSDAD